MYPNMRLPSPAAYSMTFIVRFTSPRASASDLPSSVVMVRAISSARSSRIARPRKSTDALTGAGVSAHSGAASLAAAIAARESAAVENWNSPSTVVFLAGFVMG